MAMICSICGCPFAPADRWWLDWCPTCTELNFASSIDVRLDEELAPARAALEAYVTEPVTERQRRACQRLAARWAAEAQP